MVGLSDTIAQELMPRGAFTMLSRTSLALTSALSVPVGPADPNADPLQDLTRGSSGASEHALPQHIKLLVSDITHETRCYLWATCLLSSQQSL